MNCPVDPDFLLHSYAFDLPEERIAQHPAPERGGSRLMVLPRAGGSPRIASFADLPFWLPENCLLVANNSRVIPARLWGKRPGGGKVECLLLTPPPLLASAPSSAHPVGSGWREADAEALLRPAKRIRPGDRLAFSDDLTVELLEHGPFGRCRVRLFWPGNLLRILERHGVTPLPPYIRRCAPEAAHTPVQGTGPETEPDATLPAPAEAALFRDKDRERYQTVYSREDKAGSVAAPTAGLHFTPDMRARLAASGREWAEVTLYVGYGTFSPVRSPDIRDHAMHAEYVELPEETAAAIARAKNQGRPVIAVGTTSARVLEGAFAARPADAADEMPPKPAPFCGQTDIFIYPGKPFRVIDGLITNFHLPESSLLMLVCALAGRERVLDAYQQAIAADFRFFSYGDAMLIV